MNNFNFILISKIIKFLEKYKNSKILIIYLSLLLNIKSIQPDCHLITIF